VGPTAGCGKSLPRRMSIPGPSSPWQVATPTELSRPTKDIVELVNSKSWGRGREGVVVGRTFPPQNGGAVPTIFGGTEENRGVTIAIGVEI
jgi:hypothetical protein